MQVSGLRTTIVNVANSGFGGEALNRKMADAVKVLSSEDSIRSGDNRHIATAIDSLMPASQAVMITAMKDDGVSAPATPSVGKNDTDKGL